MELTPRAQEILATAHSVAKELNDQFIGVDHIVIAILSDGRGIANNILQKHGVTQAEIIGELHLSRSISQPSTINQ